MINSPVKAEYDDYEKLKKKIMADLLILKYMSVHDIIL